MEVACYSPIAGLKQLGYSNPDCHEILSHISEVGSLGPDGVFKREHESIFATAHQISPKGHLKMLAAVQPFISGGISKTINLKKDRPTTDKLTDKLPIPQRKKLPDERQAITHKFSVGGHEGYLTVGLYLDGSPGELFIKMSKEGSTISGLSDTIAILTSFCLQYGIPLEILADKLKNIKFEPSGFTSHKEIKTATSIVDYWFKWLSDKFLGSSEACPRGAGLRLELRRRIEAWVEAWVE